MRFLHLNLLALATAIPLPQKRDLFLPPPLQDSFYDAPDKLDQLKNGEIYKSRQIVEDLQLSVQLAEAVQIAYKTTDNFGNASHTVATVFKPLITSSEPRLFSYQFWEDSAELNCSPSYTMAKGLLSPDWITGVLDSSITIQFALSQGWYVVAPDHEGPHSTFLEGYIQGQAGLDGIRAAISQLQLPADVPTTLFGYSGGGSASAWMVNLHDSYAPEINIVGAALGGTVVDAATTMKKLDGTDSLFSGFFVGAIAGLLNAYPETNATVWPHFKDSLKAAINTAETPGVCVPVELLEFAHQSLETEADVDFFNYPPLVELFRRESLLKNYTSVTYSVPKFPRYMFHAEGDQIVPYGPAKQYVDEQCAAGADIQWVPWKGDDHISLEYLGLPDAYQFLIQAYEGKTPQVQCGTAANDILTLASTTVGDVIGQGIADLIQAVNGFTAPWGTINFDPSQPYQS